MFEIIYNIGKWDFHSTIFEKAKTPCPKENTSTPIKQPQFGFWYWKLLKSLWKKLIEPENFPRQNIKIIPAVIKIGPFF